MMAVQSSTTVAVVRMDENSSKLLDAIFVLLRAFLGREEGGGGQNNALRLVSSLNVHGTYRRS